MTPLLAHECGRELARDRAVAPRGQGDCGNTVEGDVDLAGAVHEQAFAARPAIEHGSTGVGECLFRAPAMAAQVGSRREALPA